MVGLEGSDLSFAQARRLRETGAGGVILFGHNLVEPAQTIELLRKVRAALPHPPLLAIDQEGGRVSRLEPWIGPTPPAERWCKAGVHALTDYGIATGEMLAGLGFNLDFAPVVDLSPPDATNGIGDRSFSVDPAETVAAARAFMNGLQSTGVAACLKHFPGLGDTAVDSHVELPHVSRSERELDETDLEPYRRLAGRAACVMVGHAHYPALHGDEPLPGTCSPEIVRGWLRGRVGFDGLAVSDDMEMGAIAPRDQDGQAAFEAMSAGLDLLLYCHDLGKAESAIARLEVEGHRNGAVAARVREAASRVDVISRLWPAPEADPARYEAAKTLLRRCSKGVR
jgi:beta-N-acetylhexosaminidase